MPGVALDEAVSVTNPRIWFGYQTEGLMTDVASLSFVITDPVRLAVRKSTTVVHLTNDRLGNGRYAATFAPTKADGWAVGTHEIVWTYRLAVDGPQYTARQRFEVLDPLDFASGAYYVGYADSFALKVSPTFSAKSERELQLLIDSSSRRIELLTGRFFDPRFIDVRLSGCGTARLLFSDPIIGVDSIYGVGADVTDDLFEIDRTALRVYNRHLRGLLEPDDRTNPKIEFATDSQLGVPTDPGIFPEGALNLSVQGVFGYTDPDGAPLGRTPRMLSRAVGILASRESLDPYGQDLSTSQPGRIKSARTRDQAVTFATGEGSVGAATLGALTGDRTLDDLLISFLRPPEMRLV